VRFFCGVQATGRGHLSRFGVVKDILEGQGHEVFGYATGQELPSFARGIDRFDRGPTFFIRNNKIDLPGSIVYNARNIPAFFRTIREITAFLKNGSFDEAIVDFEPISARAVLRAPMRYTIFDNQTVCLLPIAFPREVTKAVRVLQKFVRFYYSRLDCARRILTYSLAPVEAKRPNQVTIPPCVRREVLELTPTAGEHILFYSSIGELPAGLIEFARKNPNIEIRAYVANPGNATGLPDNLRLPHRDSSGFLRDFASCRVYVANAGFESIAEAISLRKPILIVPIQGQWEQKVNAALIRHFGIGDAADSFSVETFERALRHESAPADEIRDWVAHGRSRLEHALLNG
jgi:uncharacterized protein (TIGR00661 family)